MLFSGRPSCFNQNPNRSRRLMAGLLLTAVGMLAWASQTNALSGNTPFGLSFGPLHSHWQIPHFFNRQLPPDSDLLGTDILKNDVLKPDTPCETPATDSKDNSKPSAAPIYQASHQAAHPALLHQREDWAKHIQKALPHLQMQLAGEVFDLEVAVSHQDVLYGLMYRTTLPEHQGMLFKFNPARGVNFWMKNTFIPLDMLFIRHHQIVHIVQNAAPCPDRQVPNGLSDEQMNATDANNTCPTYASRFPVDTVVEVPAGTAQRLKLQPGEPVSFSERQPAVMPVPPHMKDGSQ